MSPQNKNEVVGLCVLCRGRGQQIVVDLNKVGSVKNMFVCNNKNCPRYGMISVIYLEEGKNER